MKILRIVLVFLALVGIGVSAYSLYSHYRPLGESFCNFGEVLNCDIVNKSAYSKVAGIPVGLIGVVGYAVLFLLSSLSIRDDGRVLSLLLLALPWVGFLFSLYLTYIELFVLGAICILCVLSFVIITAISILATTGYLKGSKIFPPET